MQPPLRSENPVDEQPLLAKQHSLKSIYSKLYPDSRSLARSSRAAEMDRGNRKSQAAGDWNPWRSRSECWQGVVYEGGRFGFRTASHEDHGNHENPEMTI